ncbi:MAG: hypothetical protein AB8C02_12120 [Halioglobus sp.]
MTREIEPITISIDQPTSAKQFRSLRPSEPVEDLTISFDRMFNVKMAREVSRWNSVRRIGLWCTATKAALRQLLCTPGLEDIYVSMLHEHNSLKELHKSTSLKTFRGYALSSNDLCCIADLPSLRTLSAQNSNLSRAALEKLVGMEKLKNLDLEASSLDDEMASILASSRQIVQLDVGATLIGRKGLQSICEMSQLRELDIWALDIQEEDLNMLTALNHLEYLSVGGFDFQTALTSKGVLPKLAQLPSLKRLWLDGIPVTRSEQTELEERYEFVQVTCVE